MVVNHPTFGTMCAICYNRLTTADCVEDINGVKWDICKGECAKAAGIKEKVVDNSPIKEQFVSTDNESTERV